MNKASFVTYLVMVALGTCTERGVAQKLNTQQSIEAGWGWVTADDYLPSSLSMVNGTFGVATEGLSFITNGSLSRFASGRVAGYWDASGVLKVVSIGRKAQITLGVNGGAGTYRGALSGHYSRLSTRIGNAALWSELTIGQAQDRISYTTNRVELGAALFRNTYSLTANTAIIKAHDQVYGRISTIAFHKLGSADLQLTLGLSNPPSSQHFTLNALKPWAQASAIIPLNDKASLIISAGKLQPDVERAFQGVRFLTAGARFTLGKPHRPSKNAYSIQKQGIVVGKMDSDGYSPVSIYAPTAKLVAIMGDFTGWLPVSMELTGNGIWTTRILASPGPHRFVIRIDNRTWHVPAGSPAVTDDYGGTNGLLIVDAGST